MLWIFGEEPSSAAVKETGRYGNGSLNFQVVDNKELDRVKGIKPSIALATGAN
jgi:hypothetical protein